MIRNTWPLRISAAKWPADAIVSSRSTFICLVISQHLPITRTVPGERVANEGRDYQPAGQHRKGRSTSVKSHAIVAASAADTAADIARRLPIDRMSLGKRNEPVKRKAGNAQYRDRRHHQRRIEQAAGELDEIADALLRGDEFGHHYADNRQRDRYLHSAEDVWQRIRHANLPEDPPARAHEAPRHAMDVFVDGLEAKRGIYRHGEERDEKGEQQARHGAGSEPDNEQGRYRDLRDHLRDNDNRVDAEAQEGRISNHDRDHDAADDRQYEAEHSEVERRPQMAEQQVVPLDHCFDDLRRRRQDDAADAEYAIGCFPGSKKQQAYPDRPREIEKLLWHAIAHDSPQWHCGVAGRKS